MSEVLAWVSGLPQEVAVLLLAAMPVSELRGALPLAVLTFKMPLPYAYLLAVTGNLVPVVFLLWLLKPLEARMRRFGPGRALFDYLYRRARGKADLVEKYEALGLFFFVAIPLPMTGAWTGTLAAVALGVPPRTALPAILLGVLTAGIVVSTLILLGPVGGAVAAAVLLFLGGRALWLRIR